MKRLRLVALVILPLFLVPQVSSAVTLTESQIQSILSLLSSFGADQTTINNVSASLNGQPTSGTGSSSTGYTFSKDLTVGSTGADVMNLQKVLNGSADTQVSASGAGSPGNETSYFGNATKAAVIKFQTKNNISPAVGYVGPKTRATLNTAESPAVPATPAVPVPEAPAPSAPAPVPEASSFRIEADPSSPAYRLAAGNTTGNTLGMLRVSASGEPVKLTSLALKLTSGVPADLARVTLFDGETQVGDTTFTGTTTTMTLSSPVIIPQDSSKTLTLKGDFVSTDAYQAGTSGDLIQVNYDNDNAGGTIGIGQSSGQSLVPASSADTAFAGVRVFTSYPSVESLPIPGNTLVNSFMPLLRFKVSADSRGAIGVAQFALEITRTNASLSNFDIYCFQNESFSLPCGGMSSDGGFTISDPGAVGTQTSFKIVPQNSPATNVTARIILIIPASRSYYFEVAGLPLGVEAGSSLSLKLLTDASAQALTDITTAGSNNFVWTPNSTRPTTFNDRDWTNGYGVPSVSSVSSTLSGQ